jgi:ESCRT-II complex subunit VPS22
MIEMNDLIRRVGRMRGIPTDQTSAVTSGKGKGEAISREDVTRAIGLLKPLAGYSIVPVGGIDFVRSVPRELDTDQSALLVIAATTGGRLTESRIRRELGWNDVRARQALDDSVMREGLGWVDEQDTERSVWSMPSVAFEGQSLAGVV